ncbi:hypothetical protein DBV15_09375 [Temnothorax longispinosus]|uniref:Uncharacterized protein n=1 Tax=Temnothorax longispinosus TaxID=300112 RepID=A0A4S2KFM6_9HYME|nr:hypothetical protein DBV15_09375 [Temnothorax longispinosus]
MGRGKDIPSVARALGNYFTADDKNLKNEENHEKMDGEGKEEERKRKREGDIRKERQNGEKGNENEAGTVASEQQLQVLQFYGTESRNTKSATENLNEDNKKKKRRGETVAGSIREIQEGTRGDEWTERTRWPGRNAEKNERTYIRTNGGKKKRRGLISVIALVMPDAEKSGEERSGAERPSDNESRDRPDTRSLARSRQQRERRARAGAYVTGSEEADCYCSYLRPSTTGSRYLSDSLVINYTDKPGPRPGFSSPL